MKIWLASGDSSDSCLSVCYQCDLIKKDAEILNLNINPNVIPNKLDLDESNENNLNESNKKKN